MNKVVLIMDGIIAQRLRNDGFLSFELEEGKNPSLLWATLMNIMKSPKVHAKINCNESL